MSCNKAAALPPCCVCVYFLYYSFVVVSMMTWSLLLVRSGLWLHAALRLTLTPWYEKRRLHGYKWPKTSKSATVRPQATHSTYVQLHPLYVGLGYDRNYYAIKVLIRPFYGFKRCIVRDGRHCIHYKKKYVINVTCVFGKMGVKFIWNKINEEMPSLLIPLPVRLPYTSL